MCIQPNIESCCHLMQVKFQQPPPTRTQYTSTPFDSFLLSEKDQIAQDVLRPTEQQAVKTVKPEPIADLMDTTDNPSEATTTQDSQIPEDIPTTVNPEQITAETFTPLTATTTTRRQSTQVPQFNEKFLEWTNSLTKRKSNQNLSSAMEAASIIFTEKAEHRNYNEAMKSEDAVEWKAAIEEEVNSLLANQTWTLVKHPEGRNIIGCKWVFKVKPGYAGVPERYKARLVAKGFTQCYGTDYNETFSPVLKYNSLRTILAIAVHRDLDISLLDVKTAFLNGDIKEEVFMEQPKGLTSPGREDHVCY